MGLAPGLAGERVAEVAGRFHGRQLRDGHHRPGQHAPRLFPELRRPVLPGRLVRHVEPDNQFRRALHDSRRPGRLRREAHQLPARKGHGVDGFALPVHQGRDLAARGLCLGAHGEPQDCDSRRLRPLLRHVRGGVLHGEHGLRQRRGARGWQQPGRRDAGVLDHAAPPDGHRERADLRHHAGAALRRVRREPGPAAAVRRQLQRERRAAARPLDHPAGGLRRDAWPPIGAHARRQPADPRRQPLAGPPACTRRSIRSSVPSTCSNRLAAPNTTRCRCR